MANLSNINNKFLVTDEGKVGIGITAPTGILHTDQTFSGYAPVTFKNSVTNQGQFVELITSTDEGSKYTGIESKSLQTGNGWKVWGGGNNFGEMYLSVSGSPAIVIKNDLKVGVGTADPDAKFQVQGNVKVGSASGSSWTDSKDDIGGLDVFVGSGSNAFQVWDDNQQTYPRFKVERAGNVGIGTDSPGSKLTVNKTKSGTGIENYDLIRLGLLGTGAVGDSSTIGWFSTSGTKTAGIEGISGLDNILYGELAFHVRRYTTDSYDRVMTINNRGNVGIGTDSPSGAGFSGTATPVLEVSGAKPVIKVTETDVTNSYIYMGTSGGNSYIGSIGGALYFQTGSTSTANKMAIAASGSIYPNNAIQGTYFGQDAGNPANVTGVANTSIGYATAQSLTSGTANTSVGRSALQNTTEGQYNTAVGHQSLLSNTDQDKLTALGYRAGYFWTAGDENTFIGYNAGLSTAAASTGYENTFVGSETGASSSAITGVRNTALGRYNLFNITSGDDNVAIGHQSMITLTDGNFNVAVGKDTLSSYTGSKNTAIGYAAGKSINSDGDNVFVGYNAGKLRTAGIDNVAVGSFSQYGGTSGNTPSGCCNTSVGFATLHNIATGVQNTAIGRQAGYSITTTDNNTLVGHNVGIFGTGSLNTIVGAQAGSKAGFTGNNNTFLGYTAGDEVTTGGQNLVLGYAAGSGSSPFQLTTQAYRIILGDNSSTDAYIKIDWTVTSDKRDKTDFKEIEHGLDFVDKLKPTEYKFRKNRDTEETDGKRRYGFIAQEILELEGEDSVIIDTEQKDNLKYKQSHLVPVLVKAIQELKAEIELLKNK